MKRIDRDLYYAFIGFIIVGLLWELVPMLFNIPTVIFPRLSLIVQTLLAEFPQILQNLAVSFQRILLGFILGSISGIVGGFIIGASAVLYSALYPILIGIYSIPKQALIPLLVLWVGFGTPTAIVTSVLTSFFPVLVNVSLAFQTVPEEMRNLVRLNGGTNLTVFCKIGVPNALPYLFAGMRVAVIGAIVGVTLAEMLASKTGSGFIIMMSLTLFKIPLLFSHVLALTGLSLLLYEAINICDRKIAWWSYRMQR